jgi:uncharacterized membrane protein
VRGAIVTFAKSTFAVLCLAASAVWGGAAGAQAQTFGFEVCNHSGRSASVAIAANVSPTDKRFQAQGWWEVGPGQCSTIGSFPQGWFYYYAKSNGRDWPGTGEDKSSTCVRNAKFKRLDPSGYTCSSDEKLVEFNGKNVQGDTYTWTLE